MTELDTKQFIVQRKETLRKKMEEAQRLVEEAKEALAVLEHEYKALENLGRQLTPKEARAGGRTARGSLRSGILRALGEKPEGLTAAELIEAVGIKAGDKGRTSIKNALYAMTKTKDGVEPAVRESSGKYVLARSAQK
jgi:hypothetical protein